MALVAVWLTVLAPTVSRTAAAAFVFPDLGAWCEGVAGSHHAGNADHGERHADRDDNAACGYCTLFAQNPSLGGAFVVPHVPVVAGRVEPRALPAAGRLAAALRHTPARGPPVVAHA
ncbi:MAG: DUF2946 family protein [Luteibacter sp.]|jgi:hypothetical protein